MSKEKFVRDKPHMNIGLLFGIFAVGFAIAAGLTYLYPDMILPGYYLIDQGTSSLRDIMTHTSRIALNGMVYGIVLVMASSIVMKGKKILQN